MRLARKAKKMVNLIERQVAIDALGEEPEVWIENDEYAQGLNNQWHYDVNALKAVPFAQPTLYGYNIEHLDLIARVLQKENLPPERVAEALMDIGRIVAIVSDEFAESLRKAAQDE